MAQSAGLKVFVVEDETIVAMLLEQMLEELECEVAGVAGQLAQAAELARSVDANFWGEAHPYRAAMRTPYDVALWPR